MAYDSVRGVTVLFGGQFQGDTWEWNGSAWRQVSTGGPSARRNHAMAFDSVRGVTVLFGGWDERVQYADTWEWDGQSWNRISEGGPDVPEPRHHHAMAFDVRRAATVLCAGWVIGRGAVDDTWEWDGVAWQRVVVEGPTRRYVHAMAYDQDRGVVVLFGGHSGSAALGDTWEYRCERSPLPPDRWTVIVHGRLSDGLTYNDLADPEGGDPWMYRIGRRIDNLDDTPVEIHKMNRSDFSIYEGSDPFRRDAHHVLMFDWSDTSNIGFPDPVAPHGFAYAAGDALFAFLQSWGAEDKVHAMIGHSRGAVVISETTRRLILNETPPQQVVYLDGEGAPWLYFDWVFDVWEIDPSHRLIRYDNLYQTYPGQLLGGHRRPRAFNIEVPDLSHGGMRYYMVDFLEYNENRFTYRPSDSVTPPQREPRFVGDVPTVINGDFITRNEAGWRSHGGGGTAPMLSGYLSLLHAYPERVHSFTRVASDANYVQFKVARGLGTSGSLVLTWNGAQFESRAVRDIPLTWRTVRVALPPSAPGNVGRLGFHVVETGGTTHVGIDDIKFIP